MNHLKKYAILNPNKFGFQKYLSIDNAVYSLLNNILTALNNKAKVKVTFCDIEKAFECVNHNILLHKLEICEITESSKNLYSQYLRDRYQCVCLKDNLTHCNLITNWSEIRHGTFVIFIVYQ
jgi:hypothetical protein